MRLTITRFLSDVVKRWSNIEPACRDYRPAFHSFAKVSSPPRQEIPPAVIRLMRIGERTLPSSRKCVHWRRPVSQRTVLILALRRNQLRLCRTPKDGGGFRQKASISPQPCPMDFPMDASPNHASVSRY